MEKITRTKVKQIKALGFVASSGTIDTTIFNKPDITPEEVLEYLMNEFNKKQVELIPLEHHATFYVRGTSRHYYQKGEVYYVHKQTLFVGSYWWIEGTKNLHIFGAFYKMK